MTHEQIVWQGVTALVTILTVYAAILTTRRQNKAAHVETTAKLDAVQTTVNGQTEKLHNRIEDLTSTLAGAGVNVPDRPPASG